MKTDIVIFDVFLFVELGEPSPFPDIMDAKEENENVSS